METVNSSLDAMSAFWLVAVQLLLVIETLKLAQSQEVPMEEADQTKDQIMMNFSSELRNVRIHIISAGLRRMEIALPWVSQQRIKITLFHLTISALANSHHLNIWK